MPIKIKIQFGTVEKPSKLQNKQRLLLPNSNQGTFNKEPRSKPSKDTNAKTRLQSVKTGQSVEFELLRALMLLKSEN